MNFQQIRDSLGTMDGDYQAQTEVAAIVKRVKDVEYSKSGKKGQSLVIVLNGEEEWVKFTGRGVEDNPLDHNAVGNQYVFLIWPFKPDQSPKTYLYCWIQRRVSQNSSQQSQQAPSQTSQAPPQATQQTNPVPGIDITAQFLKLAERLIEAVEHVVHGNATFEKPTQQSGTNPDYVGDNPKKVADDDDIPF